MACGTPVITSHTSSMPEVAADAAHLIDPNDHKSIAEGIRKVLSETEYRTILIQKGFARVKDFSWSNNARQLVDIYSNILCS
jgi:glycosyltransferase involved in cell wall biosynthesis